jgi:lysophospholipid acyltransferase (LPLAT)-like uncharacterized protein
MTKALQGEIMDSIRKRWESRAVSLLATVLALSLQRWTRTLDARIADYGLGLDVTLEDFSRPALYIMWHEYILLPAATRRGGDMTLLISQHRDADWFSQVISHNGFKSVRGSSNKGGIKAILKYKKEHQHTSLVLTPDGPRGPRRVLTPGCIQLAALLNLPIIPVGCGYHAPMRFRSWDRFAVPRPGSRARIILGPRITIPRKLDETDLASYRDYLEGILNTVTTEAESWAMDGLPRCNERGLFPAPHATVVRESSLGIVS